MAEGLDSVCVLDSPIQSPTDAKRAPFDFANFQMVRLISLASHQFTCKDRSIIRSIISFLQVQ